MNNFVEEKLQYKLQYEIHFKSPKMPQNKNLKLKSSDGEIITVETDVIRQAITIKDMFLDFEDQSFSDDEPIPIANVTSNILNKIIEWCRHHKDENPLTEESESDYLKYDDIPTWDVEFLKVDHGTLFELTMAANYLKIKRLLIMCCKSIANRIKGKSAAEIRKTFNITGDEELPTV